MCSACCNGVHRRAAPQRYATYLGQTVARASHNRFVTPWHVPSAFPPKAFFCFPYLISMATTTADTVESRENTDNAADESYDDVFDNYREKRMHELKQQYVSHLPELSFDF